MSTPSDPTREQRMIVELQRLYALKTGGGGILIVAGAGILILAGAIVTSLISFILWNFFDSSFIGWTGWFVVYLIAIVPLLVREERRSKGSYFGDAASGLDLPASASSFGEYRMDQVNAGATVIVELLLWGPRALISGIATVRGQQPTRMKELLERAARVIVQLYSEKDAIELKKLAQPGESPAQFHQVLKWLDQNDHIGLSSDGKRAWLSSRMREQLMSQKF